MQKDILGLLILKLNIKSISNLRLTCKYINSCILSYNKFWFFRYFIKNKFQILVEKGHLKHIFGTKKKLPNGEIFIIPLLVCLTNKSFEEVNEKLFQDPCYQ